MGSEVWAVLFESRAREVDDKSKAMVAAFEGLAVSLGHQMKWGRADINDCKAFSSDFNVRTRMVPRVLLFSSRARMAEVMRLEDPTEAALEAAVRVELAGIIEKTDDGKKWMKTTLAIGGKEEM